MLSSGDITYRLMRNEFICNKAICVVRCPECPISGLCVHEFSCNCRKYAYGNFCKHLHLLALLEKEEELNSELCKDGNNDVELQEDSNDVGPLSEPSIVVVNEEEQLQDGVGQRCVDVTDKIIARFHEYRSLMKANDVDKEFKNGVVDYLEVLYEELPSVQNPSRFPHLCRKRTHTPLNRSFFPSKKNKSHKS